VKQSLQNAFLVFAERRREQMTYQLPIREPVDVTSSLDCPSEATLGQRFAPLDLLQRL
jgi:hypothetical protein